jgi:hypothetical protein
MATLTIRPSAAGDETALTVYPSGDNWAAVDDVTPDAAETFVCIMAEGTKRDLYKLEDSALAYTITSVKVYIVCHGDINYGAVHMHAKTAIKTHSTVYLGSEETIPDGGAASSFSKEYINNPNTGVAWTWTEVNALQAGVSLIAEHLDDEAWYVNYELCTQVYVEVTYLLPSTKTVIVG